MSDLSYLGRVKRFFDGLSSEGERKTVTGSFTDMLTGLEEDDWLHISFFEVNEDDAAYATSFMIRFGDITTASDGQSMQLNEAATGTIDLKRVGNKLQAQKGTSVENTNTMIIRKLGRNTD